VSVSLAAWCAASVASVAADVPVDPTAPDARQWLRDELAKAPYQAARPTWFDRLSRAFFDWISSLALPGGDGLTGWLPVVVTVVVLGALAAAVLVFGLPRWNRRSRLTGEGLLREDDRRTAADMRAAAQAAAARGEWDLASEEMFRALARGLEERTVLTLTPGMTARELSQRASAAFPAERTRLAGAAVVFDEVRYLGRPGTEQGYRALDRLEDDLRHAAPALSAPAGAAT
jgi:hypothetical protein